MNSTTPPVASILICTRDREESLAYTIRALSDCLIAVSDPVEVVLVNNGTPFLAQLPSDLNGVPLRVFDEPVPGRSRALTRGVSEAHGRWVLMTDDDAQPGRDWVRSYLHAIQAHPESSYLVGPIQPVFTSEPPPWWFALAPLSLAGRSVDGEAVRPCGIPKVCDLVGVNAAVLRENLVRHGFDTQLGAGASHVFTGEDTLLGRRLRANGGATMYVPHACVTHMVDERRLFFRYLLQRKRSVGRAATHYPEAPQRAEGIPRVVRYVLGEFVRRVRRLNQLYPIRHLMLELARAYGMAEGYVLMFRGRF